MHKSRWGVARPWASGSRSLRRGARGRRWGRGCGLLPWRVFKFEYRPATTTQAEAPGWAARLPYAFNAARIPVTCLHKSRCPCICCCTRAFFLLEAAALLSKRRASARWVIFKSGLTYFAFAELKKDWAILTFHFISASSSDKSCRYFFVRLRNLVNICRSLARCSSAIIPSFSFRNIVFVFHSKTVLNRLLSKS